MANTPDDDPALAAAIEEANIRFADTNTARPNPFAPPNLTRPYSHYGQRSVRHPAVRLAPYVCNQAWAAMCEYARRALYVNSDAARAVGVSRYIVDTIMHPTQSWVDTRPEWMRAQDTQRSIDNLPPIWQDADHCYPTRYPRIITVRGLAPDVLKEVVLAHKLATPGRMLPPLESANQQLGAILETWGQGNIRPFHEPINPPNHRTAPRRTFNIGDRNW